MSKIRKIICVSAVALLVLNYSLIENARACGTDSLRIEKEGPDCAVPGEEITYKICAWNEGVSDAINVHISDVIPVGTTFVNVTDLGSHCYTPNGSCGPKVSWKLGLLEPVTTIPPEDNEKKCVTLTVLVEAESGTIISNEACGFAGSCDDTMCSNTVTTNIEESCEEILGCRMTGGGNDTAGMDPETLGWDGTFAYKTARGKGAQLMNEYTFGGQVGASTALPPQPKGEWTHHQKKGPYGSFVFHAGTASAPEGTEISMIICSDPGFCNPARPAPAKQIDFEGVGSFKNMKQISDGLAAVAVDGVTLHRFNVHVEDLGEPGKSGQHSEPDSVTCPPEGSDGLSGDLADCDCPDFYRITIYADDAPLEEQGDGDVIYQVEGYIDGGNLQIHPLTGNDTN